MVSFLCGAINGFAAASGASWLLCGVVGAATGFVESLFHESIDTAGALSQENWSSIWVKTGIGAIGGIAGGDGVIRGNSIMTSSGKQFLSQVKTNGFCNALSVYYNTTAIYSTQFIRPTVIAIIKGWTASKIIEEAF